MTDEPPIVVYPVALNTHPLTTKDDEWPDEKLIAEVERRTTVEEMDFPEWIVGESNPPNKQLIRYVTHAKRIGVKAHRGKVNPFEEIAERVTIQGFDMDNAKMSYPPPIPVEDFGGTIHLDLTDE